MTAKEFRVALAKAGFTEEFFGKGVFVMPMSENVKAVIAIRETVLDITYRVRQPFSGKLETYYGIAFSNGLVVINAIIESLSIITINGTS